LGGGTRGFIDVPELLGSPGDVVKEAFQQVKEILRSRLGNMKTKGGQLVSEIPELNLAVQEAARWMKEKTSGSRKKGK
jgi:hypothetical protein